MAGRAYLRLRILEEWIDCASCGRVLGRMLPGSPPPDWLRDNCRHCRSRLIGWDGEWRFTLRPTVADAAIAAS